MKFHGMSSPLVRGMTHALAYACIAILLVACGASSDEDGGGQSALAGTVFDQSGPVPSARVVIKAQDGQTLGSATTDTAGRYSIAVSPRLLNSIERDGGQVFYGMAIDGNGHVLYGIGRGGSEGLLGINHLSDFLIRTWHSALPSDQRPTFDAFNASSALPTPEDLAVVADQILDGAFASLSDSCGTCWSFGAISPNLEVVLRSLTITDGSQITVKLPSVGFLGSYSVSARLSPNGAVAFDVNSLSQSSKVPSMPQLTSSPVGNLRAANWPRERWMADNWSYIKDKRLDQIVIPGSHDSGTYAMTTGSALAQTQTASIGTQLKDGIRYFDMRVREAMHRDCADPSVFWLYHTWDSYRLQTALDEIKAFLAKPGNEREVIILDFQDISIIYDDARAKDVLLATIQNTLGPYLANSRSQRWQSSTLEDLVSSKQQVITLIPNGLYRKITNLDGPYTPGCGASVDAGYFSNRASDLLSYYDEDHARNAEDILRYVVDGQLNAVQSRQQGTQAQFDAYRSAADAGRLRVLQLVSRPSNAWYVQAALPNFGTISLLRYAVEEVNRPLNRLMSQACAEGALGKRLRLGLEGDPSQWNAPNIIIADNYDPDTSNGLGFDWVLPDYDGSNWVSFQEGRYVEMIIALNRIDSEQRRLIGLTNANLQDRTCLKKKVAG